MASIIKISANIPCVANNVCNSFDKRRISSSRAALTASDAANSSCKLCGGKAIT